MQKLLSTTYKNSCATEIENIFNVTKRTLENWLNAFEKNTLSRKRKLVNLIK